MCPVLKPFCGFYTNKGVTIAESCWIFIRKQHNSFATSLSGSKSTALEKCPLNKSHNFKMLINYSLGFALILILPVELIKWIYTGAVKSDKIPTLVLYCCLEISRFIVWFENGNRLLMYNQRTTSYKARQALNKKGQNNKLISYHIRSQLAR